LEPRPRRIAVIEDDPEIRVLVEHILRVGGYESALTGDPTQAVDLVRQHDPDLVLCDITMPIMDGYGVLRALQADPTTARYPVVFLTASREFSERVRAFRFGVVDYLTKPFTAELLLRKIDRVLKSLGKRAGVVEAQADAAAVSGLLEEMKREARSGVLTVQGEGGVERTIMQAGEVLQTSGEAPAVGRMEFQELDAAYEDIVAHDPPRMPGTSLPLPIFDSLPEMVRDVLVVDDNPLFRRFLKDVLTIQGFRVDEAPNAEEGLALALERRPWLIVTDIRLPGADGFEFCRSVRSHRLVRQTPLIFLSGWDDYKERYQGMEVGADDFLSKQTPVRELLIRIQLILRRYVDLGTRDRRGNGMAGQIQVIGPPAILQMCHLNRLTGTLSVHEGTRRVTVGFSEGEIVEADSTSAMGVAAVFELLSWDQGAFEFSPGQPGDGTPVDGSFDFLLLEGCRRLDEVGRESQEAEATAE
jgi:DNA-binding response OmpR family regulator